MVVRFQKDAVLIEIDLYDFSSPRGGSRSLVSSFARFDDESCLGLRY